MAQERQPWQAGAKHSSACRTEPAAPCPSLPARPSPPPFQGPGPHREQQLIDAAKQRLEER